MKYIKACVIKVLNLYFETNMASILILICTFPYYYLYFSNLTDVKKNGTHDTLKYSLSQNNNNLFDRTRVNQKRKNVIKKCFKFIKT